MNESPVALWMARRTCATARRPALGLLLGARQSPACPRRVDEAAFPVCLPPRRAHTVVLRKPARLCAFGCTLRAARERAGRGTAAKVYSLLTDSLDRTGHSGELCALLLALNARSEPMSGRERADSQCVPDELDADGRGLLQQMKEELKAELESAPDFPELVGDFRLLRFLRGFNYDVKEACARFREHLRMRAENGVDAMRSDIVARGLEYEDLPHADQVFRCFPLHAYYSTDKVCVRA